MHSWLQAIYSTPKSKLLWSVFAPYDAMTKKDEYSGNKKNGKHS